MSEQLPLARLIQASSYNMKIGDETVITTVTDRLAIVNSSISELKSGFLAMASQPRLNWYQDTFDTKMYRQFYRDCEIYGTCNTITAQHREDEDSTSGIVLQNCTIKVAQDLSSVTTYFGRPWGKFSRTVIMESYINKLIDPRGWIE
ncbi:hypothetical protein H5410_053028 [Solanum commersonii]|uniref:Pectinesterase catalytic domain-containing protein n=1 Tax=Solanum commersonii TaxID=4109 RepID=A0A9J5X2E5_SOLCO|nr:hypothetical protein H5410_053028 [Solanum commersonii]